MVWIDLGLIFCLDFQPLKWVVVVEVGGAGGGWVVVLVVVGDWVFIFFFTLKRLGQGRERLMRIELWGREIDESKGERKNY